MLNYKNTEFRKPNFALAETGKLEKTEEIDRQERKLGKKLSSAGKRAEKRLTKKKFLKKPKAKPPKTDPKKFISKGLGKKQKTKPEKSVFFRKEMMEEAKWLS